MIVRLFTWLFNHYHNLKFKWFSSEINNDSAAAAATVASTASIMLLLPILLLLTRGLFSGCHHCWSLDSAQRPTARVTAGLPPALSHSCIFLGTPARAWRFSVQVPVGLTAPEVFLLGVLVAAILLLLCRVIPLWECIPGGLSASWNSIEILGMQCGQAWSIWRTNPSGSDWVGMGRSGPDNPVKSQRLGAFCPGGAQVGEAGESWAIPRSKWSALKCMGTNRDSYMES